MPARRPRRPHRRSAPARSRPGLAEVRCRLRPMRRRVTFSRNVTLSLSRSCVSHCKYCAFATHRPHLHEPDEVERLIDRAARRGVKELLVLTGDDPASVPGVPRAPRGRSGSPTSSPTSCGAASARSSAGCCRTRTSARSARDDLARLRHVTASQGLMLESTRDDLVAHQALADEGPGAAPGDDPRRGRAADPVHERDPRRDRRDARTTASRRSRRSPPCTPSTATCRR